MGDLTSLVETAKINQNPEGTEGGSRGTSILSGPGVRKKKNKYRSSSFTLFSPIFVLFLWMFPFLFLLSLIQLFISPLVLFLHVFPIAFEGFVQAEILFIVLFPTHQEILTPLPFHP